MSAISWRAARRPAGEQRADRREIDAHRRAGATGQLDGASPGQPERLAQERIDRQVERVGALEPGGAQVVRRQLVRGGAIGDEAPFAAGRDEHADPAGARACDAGHAGPHAVGPDRIHERPAGRIATDGRDQRGPGSEPSEPAGRRGRRAALDERDPTRHVRPRLQLAGRGEDHVEHQIAEDDDAARAAADRGERLGRPGRAGRRGRGMGGIHGG